MGSGGAPACTTPALATGPLVCDPGVSPTNPLITDFTSTTWNNTMGKWGCGLTGGVFSYGGSTASPIANMVDNTAHAFLLSGAVDAGGYGGGGLSFDECVNTAAYSGIQFTLGGTTGGCDVVLQVQTFEQKPSDATPKGGCVADAGTGGCYSFPQAKLPATTGTITVKFADLAGGKPSGATEITKEMVGLQWQFQSPPPPAVDGGVQPACTGIAMTITDVKFVP